VWTGAENFARTGIRFSVRPARSESLYGLLYVQYNVYFLQLSVTKFIKRNYFQKVVIISNHLTTTCNNCFTNNVRVDYSNVVVSTVKAPSDIRQSCSDFRNEGG
jgi:hypothetical protein